MVLHRQTQGPEEWAEFHAAGFEFEPIEGLHSGRFKSATAWRKKMTNREAVGESFGAKEGGQRVAA